MFFADLFASGFRQCRLGIVVCSTILTFRALARLAAGTGSGTAARSTLGRSFSLFGLLYGDFCRGADDIRLRAGTIIHGRSRDWLGRSRLCDNNRLLFRDRCGNDRLLIFGSRLLAAFRAILPAVTTLVAVATVAAVFARLLTFARLLAVVLVLLVLLLAARLLLLRRFVGNDRLLSIAQIVAVTVAIVHVVLVEPVAVLVVATILMLEAVLHLSLCRRDDAVVVFGMLQVVLGHNAVAGALRIASKRRVFFGDMLSRTADLNIRAGAVIGPAERIAALAVEIVTAAAATAAIVVTAAPSTAIFLLSWPHLSFTNSLSSLIRGPRPAGQKPEQDFACRAQDEQGILSLV